MTHKHEWMGRGYSQGAFSLLSPGIIRSGAYDFGGFPPFQDELTSMALDTIDVLPVSDADVRRQIFSRMVNTTNREEYALLHKAYLDAMNTNNHRVNSNIMIPDWVKVVQPSP